MTIKLYYIHGISRIDTPYFLGSSSSAIRAKQEEYFDSKVVSTVECSFYPPHYKNVIKFDKEDLDFNVNVNYLSLEFNGRVYYYFIDDVEYVSESIIRLYVTMDVIQTYLTDISIANGIIERKFINRWLQNPNTGTWYINRDYIRENVSNGEFIDREKQVILGDDAQRWLVVKISRPPEGTGPEAGMADRYRCNTEIDRDDEDKDIKTPYGYIIGPMNADVEHIQLTDELYDYSLPQSFDMLQLCTDAYVLGVYVFPFNPCEHDITYTKLTKTLTVNHSKNNVNFAPLYPYVHWWTEHQESTVMWGSDKVSNAKMTVNNLTRTVYVGNYSRCHTINTAYDKSYIPQMLDENYVSFEFGSDNAVASFPLYKLIINTVNLICKPDITNGVRNYMIKPSYDNNYVNDYGTLTTDDHIIDFDLLNDPWEQYLAVSKSRWITAGVTTGVKVASLFASMGATAAFAAKDIAGIKQNRRNYTPKRRQLNAKSQRNIANIKRNAQEDIVGDVINAGEASAGGVFGEALYQMNKHYEPPSVVKTGSVSNDVATYGLQIYYKTRYVIDYEQCAQYYHRNGFLVNQYISHTDTIFQDVNNRYYFNILKMALPEVHLNNVIEDDTTIDEIKERLIDGVRLWTVEHRDNIGDFSLDNTENMYD